MTASSPGKMIVALALPSALLLGPAIARAQDPDSVVSAPPTLPATPPGASTPDQPGPRPGEAGGEDDPTGGAYTTPTLLFIPAAALPAWNVRVIASLDVQGPTAPDRLAGGTSLGLQPGLGGELGLSHGFTIGAGTDWVGGDASPTPVSGGISPYAQARYQILGDRDGRGYLLGTSLTYKFVGFQGDPGEIEFAVSNQYRERRFEIGLQGVIGKDFATTDADAELHVYALYRVIPQLGLGGAGQIRMSIVSQSGESTYDVVSGAMASLTLGRWQLAGLAGESSIGLDQGQVGVLGEVFGTGRF
jgi:hypothetical protein